LLGYLGNSVFIQPIVKAAPADRPTKAALPDSAILSGTNKQGVSNHRLSPLFTCSITDETPRLHVDGFQPSPVERYTQLLIIGLEGIMRLNEAPPPAGGNIKRVFYVFPRPFNSLLA